MKMAGKADNERRFRALIEHSSEVIVLIGANGTILYESPSTSRIVGHAAEKFVGEKVFGKKRAAHDHDAK